MIAALPPTADDLPSTTRVIKRACETGLWLSTIPNQINSFQAIVPLMGQEKGSFFTGAYFPQKLVFLPPAERQYKPIQKHVSSYQVKISESDHIIAVPTLRTDRPLHN
jgi:hypothetical protein